MIYCFTENIDPEGRCYTVIAYVKAKSKEKARLLYKKITKIEFPKMGYYPIKELSKADAKKVIKEISGNFRYSKMEITIPFIETQNGFEFPEARSSGEVVTIYECKNGEFFLTYNEDFTAEYLKKYEIKMNFNIFSILTKVGKVYKIGTKEIFSEDEIETFFGKSKRYKAAA